MTDDKSVEPKNESEGAEAGEQKISLFLTVGLVIGALIIGLVVGYAVLSKGADDGAPAGNGGPAGAAPQLTPDQIEGGQLPSGHPPIPGTESTGAAGTGDGESTSAPGAGNELGTGGAADDADGGATE